MDLQKLIKQKKLCISYLVMFSLLLFFSILTPIVTIGIIPIAFGGSLDSLYLMFVAYIFFGIMLTALGITSVIIYIVLFVKYYNEPFKNETTSTILILGFFISIVNYVAVCFVLKEYKRQIASLFKSNTAFVNNNETEQF